MRLQDLEDTRRIAIMLVELAPAGTLLVLSGPLGAGKTTLTRYIAEALGSDAVVTSPTYTLVHEYPTPQGVLVHIDAYRLPRAGALEGLGLGETLERARLVVVEWGDELLAAYPDALWLRLDRRDDERSAELFDAHGSPLAWTA